VGQTLMARTPSRRRVYDAQDLATGMVETFNDRKSEYTQKMNFSWPRALQNVGESLAVAYASDKWKPKSNSSKREQELYKHLAESRNRAFCRNGLLHDFYKPNRSWPVRGPRITFSDCPMPRHFAILGLFEEADIQLYTAGTKTDPKIVGDDGIVKVTVKHGMLGASKMLWSVEDPSEKDEPFLFVYTKSAGVLMVIVGDELDVRKDGIVG
jgi:hypothetical protein